MSDDIAIRVKGLGKKYRIAHETAAYKTLGETVTNTVKAPFRRLTGGAPARTTEEFWALKDVSFEVKRGEVVGIIGRNGAGKSTLLKILSRITTPTEGTVEVHGRIGSLLEVGTGFHPELSGRENIYLSGSILGMKRDEIDAKFEEIVKFAEMEKFLDTPVKRYSSGMYVRLAFAVAAHLEPEILIIDEVLAVGDAAFQKKCLGKMGDVAKEGRTVLFVSHNLASISDLCERTLLVQEGRIVEDGETTRVLNVYLKQSGVRNSGGYIQDDAHVGASGDFFFRRACLVDGTHEVITSQPVLAPFKLLVEYEIINPIASIRMMGAVYHIDGQLITTFNHTDDQRFPMLEAKPGLYRAVVDFTLPLAVGDYYISLAVKPSPGVWERGTSIEWVERAVDFSVVSTGENLEYSLHNSGRIITCTRWDITERVNSTGEKP